MSSFKDFLQRDLSKTFFNLSEFADTHSINDVQVTCIVEKDTTSAANASHHGVFQNVVTIHVQATDIDRPVEGEILYLDGEMYLVQTVSDAGGDLVIVCRAYEQ